MSQLGSSEVMRPASDNTQRHLADNTLHSNTQEINKAGKTRRDKLRSAPTAVGIFPGAPYFRPPGVAAISAAAWTKWHSGEGD